MESIQITGLREVQQRLYSYSQRLGDRVVLGALRQGANLIRSAVVREMDSAGIKTRTGRLRKGFKVARSKIHKGELSGDMIGVYLTLRKGKDAPYYGRFLNDGWNTAGLRTGFSRAYVRPFIPGYKNSTRVTAPGKTNVPGKHFIQNAFDANKHSAVSLIVRLSQAGADVLARKVGL